jgi:twitching motility protein PilI
VNSSDPYDLLLEIEQQCKASAAGLPSLDKVEDEWVGVGFRISDYKLIAEMSEVKEILDLPVYTTLPGVKSWMVGVANVRGNLLPLMDLKGYIMGEDIAQRKKSRVIVIDYKGFNTGLIVEEVYGLKHFIVEDRVGNQPDVDINILPYIEMVFNEQGNEWPVFSFKQMTRDERFNQASL